MLSSSARRRAMSARPGCCAVLMAAVLIALLIDAAMQRPVSGAIADLAGHLTGWVWVFATDETSRDDGKRRSAGRPLHSGPDRYPTGVGPDFSG